MKILCSACLIWIGCRFDGRSKANKDILELLKKHILIPICPEQLGWLPTPRNPSEILSKKPFKVLDKTGNDVSVNFLKGAAETVRITTTLWLKIAIMKQRSPSCGCWEIYDGSFTDKIIQWDGITTAFLKHNNIKVFSEDQIKDLFKIK